MSETVTCGLCGKAGKTYAPYMSTVGGGVVKIKFGCPHRVGWSGHQAPTHPSTPTHTQASHLEDPEREGGRMSYVILARNPSNNRVLAISDGDDDDPAIAVYETEEEAEEAARQVPICQAWPYAIVEAP